MTIATLADLSTAEEARSVLACPPGVALSGTHLHLARTLAAVAEGRFRPEDPLTVLDIGCGDGRLISWLTSTLPILLPGRTISVHGFDIIGHGTQPADVLDRAVARLADAHPSVDWASRLALVPEAAHWPHSDGAMDLLVSNQVLEHVADIDHFMSETRRVLRPGGVAVHLFPSRHIWVEPHLHTPFAHRIDNIDLRRAWLRSWAATGLSAYRQWADGQAPDAPRDRRTYARRHADFLQRLVHYRSLSDLHKAAKRAGLNATFAWSPRYIGSALARRAGREALTQARRPNPLTAAMATLFLRHLTSVTMVVARDDAYREGGE